MRTRQRIKAQFHEWQAVAENKVSICLWRPPITFKRLLQDEDTVTLPKLHFLVTEHFLT
jgi:hypothetical protein